MKQMWQNNVIPSSSWGFSVTVSSSSSISWHIKKMYRGANFREVKKKAKYKSFKKF